jgi:hypothetical protein
MANLYRQMPSGQPTDGHEYDDGDWMTENWLWNKTKELVRAESMDVGNDPRFFTKNVMDKRLAAFKVLTLVSSLMFGTALNQCFSLKKDMNFAKVRDWVGIIAIWQIISFFLCMAIAIMCLLSLYIIAHQLFFCFRLMTAGPSGFDQAAIFYLTRTITMWRHVAIKLLFTGLLVFLATVGIQLFVKFYKDADREMDEKDAVMVVNMDHGKSVDHVINNADLNRQHHALYMPLHVGLGYITLAICAMTSCLMIMIRHEHTRVFQENYEFCSRATVKVSSILRDMSTRSGETVET